MIVADAVGSESHENISVLSVPLNLSLLISTCGASIVTCSDTGDCWHEAGTKEGQRPILIAIRYVDLRDGDSLGSPKRCSGKRVLESSSSS